MNKVKLNQIIFGDNALPFIGGPCVIESRDHCFGMAEKITEITSRLNVPFIFKSSFDKANRTSIKSFRGDGLENGLKILEEIKNNFNVPITTDIHLPEHANIVSDVVDIIQIPAFLCRQTDLLIAAAQTGNVVNVKKGQFLSPYKVENIIKKLEDSGNKNILITERGNTFGYNYLVNDFKGIQLMKKFGYPIIFDSTHSVQIPGGLGVKSGGAREYVLPLSKAASALRIAGFFIETHPNPNVALSDGPNMVYLDKMENLINSINKINKAAKE